MVKETSMRVAVRVRPMLTQEIDRGAINVIHFFDDKPQMVAALDKPFTFDHIFRPTADQEEVFDVLVKPLLDKLEDGFNCSVIAYGSTGTGKTYTMGTSAQADNHEGGMIPRVLHHFLNLEVTDNEEVEVSISFIEIYLGKVYDLLQHPEKNISVKNARARTGFVVFSMMQALGQLERGSRARRTRATTLNEGSSRSHAIFTVHYKKTSENKTIESQLHLVDLAGSEGIRRTGAAGTELQEGVNINRGLLALGKLIRDLSAKRAPSYRDDVLTSVLKDSLNVKSYICMLACVSACDNEATITVESLRFASHARGAQLRPEQIKAFRDFKAAHPEKFAQVQSLINQVPPTPSVTKFWNPTHIFTSELSNISEESASEASLVSTSSHISQLSTIPETSSAYSPIFRQYLETHLGDKLNTIVKDFLEKEKPTAIVPHVSPTLEFLPPATPANQTIQNSGDWDQVRTIIREELQTIMRSVNLKRLSKSKRLSEKFRESPIMRSKQRNEEEVDDGMRARCRLNFMEETKENAEPVFKIPALPIPKRKQAPKSSEEPQRRSQRFSEKSCDTEIIQGTPNSVNVSCRRSQRFSYQSEEFLDESFSEESPKKLRRSLRLSNAMRSVENTPDRRISVTPIKRSVERISSIRKQFEKDTYLMTPRSKKIRKENMSNVLRSVHKKHVLDILSTGTQKELLSLPTIGPKTASQIYTHRIINGDYESIEQLKDLPFWRGNSYQRFLVANNLAIGDAHELDE